jgi:hypothetical protein
MTTTTDMKAKVLISQSALRDFYNPAYCRILWKAKYMDGFVTEPTDAMRAGLVFESKLLTKSRNGFVWEYPKLKSGEPSKAETDINLLVERAKQVFAHLQIQPLEVQPVYEVSDLLAHPDLVCSSVLAPKAIVDVKYCGYADTDRFNGWSDLRKVETIQPLHYCYVHYLMFNEWVPFFYFVFFKNGGAKVIDVKLTVDSIERHKVMLNQFRNEVDMLDVSGKEPSFSQCVRCPLNMTCTHRMCVPKVEELVV